MKPTNSLTAFTKHLQIVDSQNEWNPFIFKVERSEILKFRNLIKKYDLDMYDQIEGQIEELASIRVPQEEDISGRRQFAEQLKSGHESLTTYGNWVFLPWRNNLIHLLTQDDYFDVITNRNQNKITKDQQALLRSKSVGIVGLSVGAEAAMTIAQENLCGELRISDFDTLDLSNLNRINASVDEIGTPKILIMARKILALNPYLKLKVFENGIDKSNMDQFLNGLDLVIEECDGLSLKYDIREAAKKKKINLLYAADERGFFSIEPYAYSRNLEVFHGLINERPKPKNQYANQREFMTTLCDWLGGWDNISEVSRESVLQIGLSLCGYPQLASEAKLAAAQVGHFARRMLLGEKINPQYMNTDYQTI